MRKKSIVLLVLSSLFCSLAFAQVAQQGGRVLPASGISKVGEYRVAWESGAFAVGELRSSDGSVVALIGIGNVLGSFDIPVSETSNAVEEGVVRELTVIPNPANELAVVELEGLQGEVRLEVYDMHGAQVLRRERVQGVRSVSLDVSRLAAGVYMVRVVGEAGVVGRTRFVVQH